jgi:hypothetical protein
MWPLVERVLLLSLVVLVVVVVAATPAVWRVRSVRDAGRRVLLEASVDVVVAGGGGNGSAPCADTAAFAAWLQAADGDGVVPVQVVGVAPTEPGALRLLTVTLSLTTATPSGHVPTPTPPRLGPHADSGKVAQGARALAGYRGFHAGVGSHRRVREPRTSTCGTTHGRRRRRGTAASPTSPPVRCAAAHMYTYLVCSPLSGLALPARRTVDSWWLCADLRHQAEVLNLLEMVTYVPPWDADYGFPYRPASPSGAPRMRTHTLTHRSDHPTRLL